MKNILLQQIPMDETGHYLLSLSEVDKIHNYIKNSILKDSDYILITSPMNIAKVDGDIKIIHINCKEYSYDELKDIIEKAEMYEGLCK